MRCSSWRWRNAPSPDTAATSRPGSPGSGLAVAEGAAVVGTVGADADGVAEQAAARPTAAAAAARSSAARTRVPCTHRAYDPGCAVTLPSALPGGVPVQCADRAGEVGADGRPDLLRGPPGGLEAVHDPAAPVVEPVDAVHRAHGRAVDLGLVDEVLARHQVGDAQLDDVLAVRLHRDRGADRERAVQLDPLDVGVPLGPAGHVGPRLPDGLRSGGGLSAVFGDPHVPSDLL